MEPDENGNINCTDCTNCFGCVNCVNCHYCSNCVDCVDCNHFGYAANCNSCNYFDLNVNPYIKSQIISNCSYLIYGSINIETETPGIYIENCHTCENMIFNITTSNSKFINCTQCKNCTCTNMVNCTGCDNILTECYHSENCSGLNYVDHCTNCKGISTVNLIDCHNIIAPTDNITCIYCSGPEGGLLELSASFIGTGAYSEYTLNKTDILHISPNFQFTSNIQFTAALPAELSIDQNTGVVTGSPMNYNDNVNINFKNSATFTAPLKINVNPYYDNYTFNVGDTVDISPQGNTQNITSFSYSGSLPQGVTFDTTTGKFTGTITASTAPQYIITVTYTDGSTMFVINMETPYVSLGYVSNVYEVGDSINMSPNSGFVNFSYSGTLPPGISFDTTTGKIYQAITEDARETEYYITITAKHENGHTVTEGLNFYMTGLQYYNPVKVQDTYTFNFAPHLKQGNFVSFQFTGNLSGVSFNTSTGMFTGIMTATSISGSVIGTTASGKTYTAPVTLKKKDYRSISWPNYDNVGNEYSSYVVTEYDYVHIYPSKTPDICLKFNSSNWLTEWGNSLTFDQYNGVLKGWIPRAFGSWNIDKYFASIGVKLHYKDADYTYHEASPDLQFRCYDVYVNYNNQTYYRDNFNQQLTITPNISHSDKFYWFEATGLPEGFAINPNTGVISGVTNKVSFTETYNVTVKYYTIDRRFNETATFTITINNFYNISYDYTIPTDFVNYSIISLNPNITGDLTPNLSFSVTGITEGLDISIDSSSGIITLTTNSDTETYNFTVNLICGETVARSTTYNLTAKDISSIYAIDSFLIGESVNITPIFELVNAKATGLPSGLTIDSSGNITGTVTGDSDYEYNITITCDNITKPITYNGTVYVPKDLLLDYQVPSWSWEIDFINFYFDNSVRSLQLKPNFEKSISIKSVSFNDSSNGVLSFNNSTYYITCDISKISLGSHYNCRVTFNLTSYDSYFKTDTLYANVSVRPYQDIEIFTLPSQEISIPKNSQVTFVPYVNPMYDLKLTAENYSTDIINIEDDGGNHYYILNPLEITDDFTVNFIAANGDGEGKQFINSCNISIIDKVLTLETTLTTSLYTLGTIINFPITVNIPENAQDAIIDLDAPDYITFENGRITGTLQSFTGFIILHCTYRIKGNVILVINEIRIPVACNDDGRIFKYENTYLTYNKSSTISPVYALPYDLTLISGDLPPGMTFNNTGEITGTPTTEGTYTIEIQQSDDFVTQAQTVNIIVGEAPSISYTNESAFENEYIEISPSSVKGSALQITATGLPEGLTINETTGVITGVCSSGTYNITVTATCYTATASDSFTLAVEASSISYSNISVCTSNTSYTVNLTPRISVTAESFSATNLPVGLEINPDTGVISGIISEYTNAIVTVSAVTSLETVTKEISIYVNFLYIDFSERTLHLHNGDSFNFTPVNVRGNITKTSFSGTVSDLNLSINNDYVISGTVSSTATEGTKTFNLILTDEMNFTYSTTFNVVVNKQPTLSYPNIDLMLTSINRLVPTINVGQSVTSKSFSATNLPSGLTIDSETGIITGKTASTGVYNFSVTLVTSFDVDHECEYNTVTVNLYYVTIDKENDITYDNTYSVNISRLYQDVTGVDDKYFKSGSKYLYLYILKPNYGIDCSITTNSASVFDYDLLFGKHTKLDEGDPLIFTIAPDSMTAGDEYNTIDEFMTELKQSYPELIYQSTSDYIQFKNIDLQIDYFDISMGRANIYLPNNTTTISIKNVNIQYCYNNILLIDRNTYESGSSGDDVPGGIQPGNILPAGSYTVHNEYCKTENGTQNIHYENTTNDIIPIFIQLGSNSTSVTSINVTKRIYSIMSIEYDSNEFTIPIGYNFEAHPIIKGTYDSVTYKGDLPPGIIFDNGNFSGAPSETGVYQITVTLSNVFVNLSFTIVNDTFTYDNTYYIAEDLTISPVNTPTKYLNGTTSFNNVLADGITFNSDTCNIIVDHDTIAENNTITIAYNENIDNTMISKSHLITLTKLYPFEYSSDNITIPANNQFTLKPIVNQTDYLFTANSLPEGITLDSDGTITCDGITEGEYSITIHYECDYYKNDYILTISAVNSDTLIDYEYNNHIKYAELINITPVNNLSDYNVSYTSNDLPSFISLNPSTGALQSENNIPGCYNFTVTCNASNDYNTLAITKEITLDICDENGNLDCDYCTDCTNCTECINCIGCTDCSGCTNCTNCTECTNCTDCTECIDCHNGKVCKKCESCVDLIHSNLSNNSNNIIFSFRVENSSNVYYCTECNNCHDSFLLICCQNCINENNKVNEIK